MNQTAPAPKPLSIVDRFNIHPFVFAGVSLGLIFALYHVGGGIIAFLAVGSKITRENVATVRWITTAGQLLFILVPTLVFARLLSNRFGDVFWWRMPSAREVGFMLIGLISLQQLLEVYMFLQDFIPVPAALRKLFDPMREMYRSMLKTVVKAESGSELILVILVAAVVPAFVEEMMFRGVIQRTFERVFKPMLAVLVTGIIFGLFHLDPFNAVPLICIGCYMGFLRLRSKSIALPITAHFLNNLVAIVAVHLGMGFETKLTTTEFGISEVLAAVTQAVAFGGLFFLSFRAYVRATDQLQVAS